MIRNGRFTIRQKGILPALTLNLKDKIIAYRNER